MKTRETFDRNLWQHHWRNIRVTDLVRRNEVTKRNGILTDRRVLNQKERTTAAEDGHDLQK
jgi:hypothetical protein